MELKDVVMIQEGHRRSLNWLNLDRKQTAAHHLVARLYTDAIFNQDIRCIQTIINRIDGGVPKESDIPTYRTDFADCVREVLAMDDKDQITVYPNDTVMLALAKQLYEIACEDIYWDVMENKARRPSDNKKMLRDAAMRMILERSGGRKEKVEKAEVVEEIELPAWVQKALPSDTIPLS